MQDYKKLNVWKKAHMLTVAVYGVTRDFPRDEMFTLTSQIRRACISVPANIVEGCGRGSNIELARFLQIASGSAHELEYHLLLAKELGYLRADEHSTLNNQVIEIKRMLTALISKIKAKYPNK
jgi:four helix bundle protein